MASKWEKRATRFKRANIMIAPEIFTTQEDITLADGKIILKGSKYFAWPTACALVAEDYTGDGWRLPTIKEADAICKYYHGDGPGLLALGLDGFITPNDMTAYSYMPEKCTDLIVQQGQQGYYWTSELSNQLYPYAISTSGYNIRAYGSIYLSYGVPMLLVKDL